MLFGVLLGVRYLEAVSPFQCTGQKRQHSPISRNCTAKVGLLFHTSKDLSDLLISVLVNHLYSMADNNQKNRERQIRFVYRKIDTSVHQLRFSIHQLYTNFHFVNFS